MGLLQGGSCGKDNRPAGIPATTSQDYRPAIRSFFVGIAAMQAGDTTRALKELTETTRLAPDEPAALANLAILEMQGQRVDDALKHLERARELAPNDGRIVYLHALAKSQKGDFAGATADYKRAAELDTNNLRARYSLVEQVQQNGGPEADTEARRLLEEIDNAKPNNMVVLLDLARLAGKRGDAAVIKELTERLAAGSEGWPASVKEQLAAVQSAIKSGNVRGATSTLLVLRNVLMQVAKYRVDIAQLKAPVGEVGEPIVRLIKLQNPPLAIASADNTLAFSVEPLADSSGPVAYATTAYAGQDAKPAPLTISGTGALLPGLTTPVAFKSAADRSALGVHPVAAVDLNGDFKTDFALAGSRGLRIYTQSAPGAYAEATAKAKLPAGVAAGNFRGVWAADVDLDGDVDLVVAPASGPAVVLRNNADGTFKAIQPLSSASGIVDFAWADLDNDGDPDAALLDSAGAVHFYFNERAGQFRQDTNSALTGVAAIAALDSDDDGQLDLVAIRKDGVLQRVQLDLASGASESWKSAEVGRWDGAKDLKPGGVVISSGDLDNNGGIDLFASSGGETRVWLHSPDATYNALAAPVKARAFAAADMNGDGRLDLFGIGADGKAATLTNQGKTNYAWQEIRAQATKATGDQRINSYGIGGSIEVRAGFLTQRQLIEAPAVHFGLGQNTVVDAARIFWPNGQMQAEFALQPNQSITSVQRLKGSCPWLFAWDGSKMAFITDTLWRSPLGLRINAQDTGKVVMTEEWVRVPGGRLVPRDGAYDIRITAELWETHFFDHVSLLTVDHPVDTEIWVDERFSIPPPKNAFILTKPSVPVARATDDAGADVTATVRELDGQYLATFGRGRYQGVTKDHFIEVELGQDVPDSGTVSLICQGWLRPTDSSINVAMAQGDHPKPQDLSLEIPDGRGGWKVARTHLGFPAGKNKSIVLDISGLFQSGQTKRLRLRTNLEIYWDRISCASAADAASVERVRTKRSLPDTAELRFRGYSATRTANASSPELPDYEDLSGTAPRWCDLVGYYTRFGGVRELLKLVDDRYVIMNAGDEMRLRFAAAPEPASGLKRDFVVISDGWEKDGDFNTGFSKTVLPLPSHADPAYSTPPTTLEKDPVYRRYPGDWQTYHTRYVTPEGYWAALRMKASKASQ
jgi:Tfp pilus assembly protein PilF